MKIKIIIAGFIFLMLLTKFSIVVADTGLDVNHLVSPSISLTPYISLLEDASQQLTLTDIQQENPSSQFKIYPEPQEKTINLSYTSSAYWLRIVFENSSALPIEKIIELESPLLKYVDFYWQIDHKDHQTIHTGYARPLGNRVYVSTGFVFPVQFPAHSQHVIYIRVASPNVMFIDMTLWDHFDFYKKEHNSYLYYGFFISFMVVTALFSLGLALVTKKVTYFIYPSLVLCVTLEFIAYKGLGVEFFWPNSPWLTQIGTLSFGLWAVALLILAINQLFDLKTNWFYKGLMGALLMLPLLLLSTFTSVLVKGAHALFIVAAAYILISAVMGVIQKKRSTYFLALGLFFVPVSLFVRILNVYGVITSTSYTQYGLQVTAIVESMLFIFFLMDSYRLLEKEKQINQKNLLESNYKLVAAEQANQFKSTFVSHINHELRTPLNIVLGFSALLQIDKSLNATQLDYVLEILQAGNHQLNIINQLLDISKIDSGHLQLIQRSENISTLIEHCLCLVIPLAQQMDVRLHYQPVPEIIALCDRTRLIQLILNLISNAIKYNVKQGTVDIILDVNGKNSYTIHVIDSGIGMDAHQLNNIFLPFIRLTTNEQTEGTGLGLSITKELVELMGGVIGVKSELGVGSHFWITLPLLVANLRGDGEWQDDLPEH